MSIYPCLSTPFPTIIYSFSGVAWTCFQPLFLDFAALQPFQVRFGTGPMWILGWTAGHTSYRVFKLEPCQSWNIRTRLPNPNGGDLQAFSSFSQQNDFKAIVFQNLDHLHWLWKVFSIGKCHFTTTMGRSTLLMALIVCMDSVFLLENPGGSCILQHVRLQWLFRKLKEFDHPAL